MRKIVACALVLGSGAGVANADATANVEGYFGAAFGSFDGNGIFQTADGKSSTGLTESSYVFVYDLDVTVSATGTSDSGLTFGASIDIDDAATAQGPISDLGSAGEIFVAGDFGTLAMGDIDDAAESVVGDLAGVGLTGLGDFNEMLYLVTSGAEYAGSPVALYTYRSGHMTLAFAFTDDRGWSAGGEYGGDFWDVGLAYESVQSGATITLRDPGDLDHIPNSPALSVIAPDNAHQTIAQGAVRLAGVTLKGAYGLIDAQGEADLAQYGVSAEYGWSGWTVAAYFREADTDFDDPATSDIKDRFYGLGATYDLGGGLLLAGGVAVWDFDDLPSEYVVGDFGISFNF
ncbi:MAG: porin [Rhodobacteraceae bacterium]|nr:porin [Paracoccaceae bacterium]